MTAIRQYQAVFHVLNQKLTISLYSANNTNLISHLNLITVLPLRNTRHKEKPVI
jgi:hypothetical protein